MRLKNGKMTQSTNILNELKELNSSLAGTATQNAYTVPAGYFEGLIGEAMNRIRAIEAANVKEELIYLSPILNDVSRQMPYSVPDDYFSSLAEQAVANTKHTVTEELEAISPFLGSLKKNNPYAVPDGYFDAVNIPVNEVKQEVKVVSITSRRWFRYAAAAVVVGFLALGSISLFKKQQPVTEANSHAWIEKKIKNVSTDNIDEFLQLAEKEKNYDLAVTSSEKPQEVNDLLKDISDKDLQDFIHDTEPLTDEGTETSLN